MPTNRNEQPKNLGRSGLIKQATELLNPMQPSPDDLDPESIEELLKTQNIDEQNDHRSGQENIEAINTALITLDPDAEGWVKNTLKTPYSDYRNTLLNGSASLVLITLIGIMLSGSTPMTLPVGLIIIIAAVIATAFTAIAERRFQPRKALIGIQQGSIKIDTEGLKRLNPSVFKTIKRAGVSYRIFLQAIIETNPITEQGLLETINKIPPDNDNLMPLSKKAQAIKKAQDLQKHTIPAPGTTRRSDGMRKTTDPTKQT